MKRLRELAFWVKLVLQAARERIQGIECLGCSAHTTLPVPNGWRYGTIHTGDSAWLCPDCQRQGSDYVNPYGL